MRATSWWLKKHANLIFIPNSLWSPATECMLLNMHTIYCSPSVNKTIVIWTNALTSTTTFSSSILPLFAYTVLSRVNTHGRSQLKRQKLRVGGYTEKVLNYLRARAHLGCGCKVSCQSVPHRRFVCASSRPTRQWRKLYHTTKLTDS